MDRIDGVFKNSRIPLYQQVKAYLMDFIRNQDEEIGTIPPEAELCRKFGLSRGTVRTAVLELVNAGILERVSGKGTYIKKPFETLRFASWLSGEESARYALAQLHKSFYKRTRCVVEEITIPYLEMERSLIAMASRGEAPDLASLINLWTPILAYYDALYPLDELYTYEVMNNLYPQTISPLAYNDRMYGFNWINGPNILYYNKNLVERYGETAELSTGTYPELLEHCIRIYERSKGQVIPFSIPILDDELFFLYNLFNYLYAFDGGLVNDDGEVIFNSQATIDAFAWLKSLTNRAHVNMSNSFMKNRRLFANDSLAFIIEGPWLRNQIPLMNVTGRHGTRHVGYSVLPRGSNGKSNSILWSHTLSVFRQCENKELAIELVKFLALDPSAGEIYHEKTGMLPVNRNELKNNPVYNDAFGKVVQQQMETAIPIKTGKPNSFLMAVMICANASREILLGDASISGTLNNYAEIIREIYRH